MATIPMIPVGLVTTLNRFILRLQEEECEATEAMRLFAVTVDLFYRDFDPSIIGGNPVYQCGVCGNNNDLPFAASDGGHRFAADSPLEGDGFEPSVPRQKDTPRSTTPAIPMAEPDTFRLDRGSHLTPRWREKDSISRFGYFSQISIYSADLS
jgi:hypothetical protein